MVTSSCRPSGKVLPENFRRKRWALCHAMNWKDGWPEDFLRLSYGLTISLKIAMPPSRPSKWGRNARMLYAHYREVVKNSDDITSY